MDISEKVLTNRELFTLVNESSISVIIESSDRMLAVNSFFCDITGYSEEELGQMSFSALFTDKSVAAIDEYKDRIINNLDKSQTIRNVDKRLKVSLLGKDGKQADFLMLIIPLSRSREVKWGYKLIEQSLFHIEKNHIEKMERLKDNLLALSQSLIRLKDIQNFYEMVLEAAGSTINEGTYCTILKLVDGDTFVPVAARGYAWDVMADFKLPVKESFSWLLLGHLLDRTIIVDDIDKLCEKTEKLIEVKGYVIKSSLQTPIYLNNELFGILTIDSSRKNVFTEDDFNTIEYLRTQIQIALENQMLYNKMQHQVSHDKLTDVASRGAFEEQVIKFLRTRHHYESCCIIMMDLNDLKVVNDVWGHLSGDRYLLGFISAVQKHMRGSDLLARLGGDEFAICFFSSQSAQFIGRIEEIQKNFIDSPQDFNGTAVSCYFSYGIAHCPEDGETYDVLINTADSRMYEMKALLKGQKQKNDLQEYRK